MIFNGEVICTDDAKSFFEGNTFYTTSANRVSRGLLPAAVTCEDVIGALT
jgi:energy-coupling factor transport system ATP-binding protein